MPLETIMLGVLIAMGVLIGILSARVTIGWIVHPEKQKRAVVVREKSRRLKAETEGEAVLFRSLGETDDK